MHDQDKPIISVTVTAYKRPQYIEEAIKSYLYQNFTDSEMLILDDCVEDTSVKLVVEKYSAKDPRIKLIKNDERLGYCKNFLKSLLVAQGKYIVTLGDDDLLIDPSALATYIKVFDEHPDVSYIYSNMVQINQDMVIDYVFDLFDQDIYCTELECSLKKIWLRSCFIAGIGLRNNIDFAQLYPSDNILFPQVELIGKILGNTSSYGISQRLVGARAHLSQLGNVALSGKNIKDNERHSVYELNMVFDRVMAYYSKTLSLNPVLDRSFVNDFFEVNHKAIFANEKISNGNAQILKTFIQAIKNNPSALFDFSFTVYFVTALLLPKRVLFLVKEFYRSQNIKRHSVTVLNFSKNLKEIKNV